MVGYIRTQDSPHIFYCPRNDNDVTKSRKETTKDSITGQSFVHVPCYLVLFTKKIPFYLAECKSYMYLYIKSVSWSYFFF